MDAPYEEMVVVLSGVINVNPDTGETSKRLL